MDKKVSGHVKKSSSVKNEVALSSQTDVVEPRIGVYICHCGGNISNTVDVAKVKENVAKLKGVVAAETNEYVCSDPGQR